MRSRHDSDITARNAGPCGGPALPLRKQGGHRFEPVGTTEKRLLADLRGRLVAVATPGR